MNVKKIFLFSCFTLSMIVIFSSFIAMSKKEKTDPKIEMAKMGGTPTSPTSLEMYELIDKYSDKYEIPKHIAFNVAFLETRYCGPFDWKYKPSQTSSAGAVGPMQIMPTTANDVHHRKVSVKKLKTNIKFNIQTSMKLLHTLHNRYGNWSIVCGYYNTGHPKVNNYARFCVKNIDYQKNWKYLRRV